MPYQCQNKYNFTCKCRILPLDQKSVVFFLKHEFFTTSFTIPEVAIVVAGGSLVISFSSQFLRLAIDKEKVKQNQDDFGNPIELNFKLYSIKVIKVKFTKNIAKNLHYLAVDGSYLWRKRRSSITKSWTANHGIFINIWVLQTTRRKR